MKITRRFIAFLLTFILVCGIGVKLDVHAACNHTGKGTVTKQATCTSTGTEVVKCTKCGAKLGTYTIAAKGHSWSTTKSATCGSAGSKKCTRCGATASIPATGNHNPTTSTTNPTCTQSGSSRTYCRTCGTTLSTKSLPATGHSMSTIKNATCGSSGTSKCSKCSYSVTIPATGNHNPASRVKTSATCTSDGLKETYCTTCNTVLSSSKIDKTGHNYETVTIATCGKDGLERCSRCHDEITVHASGDHHVAERTKKEPTCSEEGEKEIYCLICNTVRGSSKIEKTPHNYETVTIATCGKDGLKRCVNCDDEKPIPATGDHHVAERTKKEPTCSEEGEKEIYCFICNTVLGSSKIEKTPHNYETVTIATCGKDGLKRCVNCDDEKPIPATENHSLTTRVSLTPTCKDDGMEEVYCQTCGEVVSYRILEKRGNHKMVEADCEHNAHCMFGDLEIQNSALGHLPCDEYTFDSLCFWHGEDQADDKCYVKCVRCGEGIEREHVYHYNLIPASGQHTRYCRCGYGSTTEWCSSDDGDDICDYCGASMSYLCNIHIPADCWHDENQAEDKHWIKCANCNKVVESEHSYQISSNNNGTHTRSCECGFKTTTEICDSHDDDKRCDYCGASMSLVCEAIGHAPYEYNWDNRFALLKFFDPGQDDTDEVCYFRCKRCDKLVERNHEYNYYPTHEGTHTYTCPCTNERRYHIIEKCVSADGDNKCDICGDVITHTCVGSPRLCYDAIDLYNTHTEWCEDPNCPGIEVTHKFVCPDDWEFDEENLIGSIDDLMKRTKCQCGQNLYDANIDWADAIMEKMQQDKATPLGELIELIQRGYIHFGY